MPQRMARKRIHCQQRRIKRQHQCANADSKTRPIPVRPPAGVPHVNRQQHQKQQREVQKIPVQVLKQQQTRFTFVGQAAFETAETVGFSHGTANRIHKEGAVIRLAVIVAGDAEPARSPQNQKRGRNPCQRLWNQSGQQWRIKRGQQIAVFFQYTGLRTNHIQSVVQRSGRRVDDETPQSQPSGQGPGPPCVSPRCRRKPLVMSRTDRVNRLCRGHTRYHKGETN